MKTIYRNLYEISELQQKIMRYIDYWVHTEKTLVSKKRIIEEMRTKGRKDVSIVNALSGLLKLGYIRRAITNGNGEDGIGSEKTKYVQLRRL